MSAVYNSRGRRRRRVTCFLFLIGRARMYNNYCVRTVMHEEIHYYDVVNRYVIIERQVVCFFVFCNAES